MIILQGTWMSLNPKISQNQRKIYCSPKVKNIIFHGSRIKMLESYKKWAALPGFVRPWKSSFAKTLFPIVLKMFVLFQTSNTMTGLFACLSTLLPNCTIFYFAVRSSLASDNFRVSEFYILAGFYPATLESTTKLKFAWYDGSKKLSFTDKNCQVLKAPIMTEFYGPKMPGVSFNKVLNTATKEILPWKR